MMDKKSLRKEKLKCRDSLPEQRRRSDSEQIARTLAAQPEVSEADEILCYLNFRSEVETLSFAADCLKRGKRVFCPKVLDEARMEFYEIDSLSDLQPGAYGILEPAASDERLYGCIQTQRASASAEKKRSPGGRACMILPGAAFDKQGNRIGYGKGYYDRYLTQHDDLYTIGICFSCQMTEVIPAEAADKKVDKIITENEVYTIV